MNSFELKIRVIPGASQEGVVGWHAGALKVKTQAPPEGGKANRAICGLIARECGLAKKAVHVSKGHTSREKVIRIEGIDRAEFERRLKLS